MPENNHEYFNQRRGLFWLWAGVAAGPLAVTLAQQAAYLLVTLDCSYGIRMFVAPVLLLALALAASGVFIAWRNWRRAGPEWKASGGDTLSRSRFLALIGLLFSGFAVLVVLALWLPVFFYRQCQR